MAWRRRLHNCDGTQSVLRAVVLLVPNLRFFLSAIPTSAGICAKAQIGYTLLMKHIIRIGDVVTFRPEWSDPGDEYIVFRAVEDEYDDGRLVVVAEIGLPFNPTQAVSKDMIATINGTQVRS